jgi:hypothetical protein
MITQQGLPEPGQIVRVRQRLYLVERRESVIHSVATTIE